MGAADVVPGISGGTVAFVLGIYERLLTSIQHASSALGSAVRARPDRASARLGAVEWLFVLPLLAGLGLSVVIVSGAVEHQLEARPIQLSGLFLGLVLGGVVVTLLRLKARNRPHVLVAAVVGGGMFALFGLADGVIVGDVAQSTSPATWAFFVSGMVAISAMILPGISGSLMLVILGMYQPVLDAVSSRDAGGLAPFVAGALVGLAIFSQALQWAFRRHHDLIVAAMTGLMLGSLRVLWPWPDGINGTGLGSPSEAVLPTALLAIAGAGLVLSIDHFARRRSPAGILWVGELLARAASRARAARARPPAHKRAAAVGEDPPAVPPTN